MKLQKYIFLFCFAKLLVGVEVTESPKPAAPVEDIALPRAIQMALSNSHEVKQSKESYEAAEAAVRRVRSSFYPKVSAEVTAGTYHDRVPLPGSTSVPTTPTDRNNYVAGLKLSQSLFAGFRDASAFARVTTERTLADKELQIAKENMAQTVIQLYFGIQLLLRNIESEKEVKTLRAQQYDEVKNKMLHGSATELAALQVEYTLKAQQPQISALEADLESRKLKLARLMGFSLDQSYKLKSDLPDASVPLLTTQLPAFSDAFEFALKNNPNFAKYELQLTQLQNQTGEVLSKHLPTLDFIVNGGTNAYQRFDIGSSDSLTYSAELKLTVPLFSGLDSFAERSEQQSKLNALKEARSAYRESVLEQLNDAYRQLELASTKWEADKVNLVLTEKTVSKARAFYRMGRATLAEVLDSYSQFLTARRSATQTKFDRVVALFKIKSLLGVSLSDLEKKAE